MRRISLNIPLETGCTATLNPEQAHYLYDVLRMQAGDRLIGVDSCGRPYVIQLALKHEAEYTVIHPAEESNREPGLLLRFYLPLLKGDKLDLVVQKAVELGCGEILLYEAQRSVVKLNEKLEKKLARLSKIAMNATQQCGRHRVPCVQGLLTLEEVCAQGQGIFAWEKECSSSLREHLSQSVSEGYINLLTGPEGGLSESEAARLHEAGWTSVSLGPRILRAETAAIAMLACTMFAAGEMG